MSKDGYLGQGRVLLDPGTLLHLEKVLKERGQEVAAGMVREKYEATKKEIERAIRYSR